MRTNKTIIGIALGVSVPAAFLGTVGFAADGKSVPMKAVTRVMTTTAAIGTAAPIVQPKFENFDPAKYTGETGKIVLPCSGNVASVTLRKWVDGQLGDYLQISGKGSELVAPVGSYKLLYYYVSMAGKEGRNWSIGSNRAADDKSPIIEVKANESIELGTAKQLQAAIESGKTGSIKLPCKGQAAVSLRLAGDDKFQTSLEVSGKGSELTVPVGSYRLGYYFLSVAGKNGGTGRSTMLRYRPKRPVCSKSSPAALLTLCQVGILRHP